MAIAPDAEQLNINPPRPRDCLFILRAVPREVRASVSRPVAVVAFADEEGARFGLPCAGSRLLTGHPTLDAMLDVLPGSACASMVPPKIDCVSGPSPFWPRATEFTARQVLFWKLK